MLCVRSAVAGLASAVALIGPVAAADSDELRRFGLIGTWAVNCAQPDSSSNPYVIYAVKDGSPIWILQMGDLQARYSVRQLKIIGEDVLDYIDGPDQAGRMHHMQLKKTGARFRSIASTREDGSAVIADGKFVASGAPTAVFENCPSR